MSEIMSQLQRSGRFTVAEVIRELALDSDSDAERFFFTEKSYAKCFK